MFGHINKSKITQFAIRRLTTLSVPIPPPELFERAIGYQENERYLALYFQSESIYYEDAATWSLGNREPWDLWAKVIPEWRIEIEFAGVEQAVGSRIQNWFLLDRHTRRGSYGVREEVIPILAGQLPLPGRAAKPDWESIRAEVIFGMADWYRQLGF